MTRPGAALVFAAIALLAAIPARANDAAGARTFVVWLYSHYPPKARANSFDVFGAQSTRIFDSSLLDLIKRDQEVADDQAPDLDGDPLCDCQDNAGLNFTIGPVSAGEFGRASATVARHDEGVDAQIITLDLTRTADGWRVYDVGTKDTPSLRTFLIKSAQEWKGR